MVEALKDQFAATRHQAAVKAEATRMLALDMLRAKLHEIKSVSELTRVISMLSQISENDLAAVCGGIAGTGPLLNIQQLIGMGPAQRLALPEWTDKASNPVKDASQVLESFNLLTRYLQKETTATVIDGTVDRKPESKRED